jgi:hypothetical protein
MDVTYTMIGVDGLQYGPITLEQLKSWIGEGRVTPETKILRSDTRSWLPAANYSELELAEPADAPPSAPPVAVGVTPAPIPAARPVSGDELILRRRVCRGASWFFIIAGLSAINLLLMYSHQGLFFVIGLGANWIVQDLTLNIVIIVFFAVFGWLARTGQSWAFIIGMLMYAGDAAICVNYHLWLSLAFHAYALYRIFEGLQANMAMNSLKRT